MNLGRFFKLLLPGLVLLGMALLTGEKIFLLAGFMLLGMIAYGIISILFAFLLVRANSRARIGYIEKGDSWRIEVSISLFSPFPIGQIGLELRIPFMHAGNVAVEECFIHPFGKKNLRRKFPCEFRGVYECGVVCLYLEDIFGIFHWKKNVPWAPYEVKILPKYIPLTPFEGSAADDGNQAMRSFEDTNSYADLRAYEQGDSLRRVHWKLSLKKREILVREFEALTMPDMLLLLDVTPPEGLSTLRKQVEDLLCDCAASVAHAQLSANYPVYMPLFMQENNMLLHGQGNRDFPAFLEALMQVSFDGVVDMSEIMAKETRLFQGSHCVLILSRITPDLADNVLRVFGAFRLRIIAVFEEEGAFEDEVRRLRNAGVFLQIITPGGGLKELAKGESYA